MTKLALSIVALFGVIAASSAYLVSNPISSADAQLKGYDLVSYFVEDTPVIGQSQFAAEHEGNVYHFANQANQTAFMSNPKKYLPQYDGHCSYGVSLGQKFDIDPMAYRIVDGRLFLQLDPGTRTLWMEAEDENIRLADKNWPQLQTSTN